MEKLIIVKPNKGTGSDKKQKAILPKSSMSLNLNNIQRVEVGHKQVGFSIG